MTVRGKELEGPTKHERLMQYIQQVKIGTKLSVRTMAEELGVSEGTAYKAIKEAETQGLVSTKERIGTVRIDRKKRGSVDRLTFGEVADIVEGEVIGGAAGLDKTLHKFVIGAMELEAMVRYIDAGSLLIVGNRQDAHRCAIEQGAGVLITGGFGTNEDVKHLSDQLGLPIISCKHDTYTVASMINRAMFDRLIRQKIMLVEDIVTYSRPVETMRLGETNADFRDLSRRVGGSVFPVLDDRGRVVGMMTTKDAADAPDTQLIDKLMTKSSDNGSTEHSVSPRQRIRWLRKGLIFCQSSTRTGSCSRQSAARRFSKRCDMQASSRKAVKPSIT